MSKANKRDKQKDLVNNTYHRLMKRKVWIFFYHKNTSATFEKFT